MTHMSQQQQTVSQMSRFVNLCIAGDETAKGKTGKSHGCAALREKTWRVAPLAGRVRLIRLARGDEVADDVDADADAEVDQRAIQNRR